MLASLASCPTLGLDGRLRLVAEEATALQAGLLAGRCPLGYVTRHIVQAEFVGLLLADGMYRRLAVDAVPRHLVEVVASGIRVGALVLLIVEAEGGILQIDLGADVLAPTTYHILHKAQRLLAFLLVADLSAGSFLLAALVAVVGLGHIHLVLDALASALGSPRPLILRRNTEMQACDAI